ALRGSGLALIGPVGHSRIRLPAGPAVVARVAFRDEETGESAVVLQYALLHRGSVYVLSYSALAGRFASYRPTFARSAASFRFAGRRARPRGRARRPRRPVRRASRRAAPSRGGSRSAARGTSSRRGGRRPCARARRPTS